MIGTIGLALLAGVLSVLSPCVLPLVPIVLGTAASEHRLGPVALAGGLALSFTVVGLFVATIGFAVGLDAGLFRTAAALLLVGIGGVLMLPSLQARLAGAAGPVGTWTEERFGGFSTSACRVSSVSGYCWAQSGVPASARPSAQPRCSLRAVRAWVLSC